MTITYASDGDRAYLIEHDPHVSAAVMNAKVEQGEVLVAHDGGRPVGWLRFGYFWDEVPFMNMLFVDAASRGQGFGRALIEFWEADMRARGHDRVMTSTLSNELAQHLYRKLGYVDCGALLLPGEALEILFIKALA